MPNGLNLELPKATFLSVIGSNDDIIVINVVWESKKTINYTYITVGYFVERTSEELIVAQTINLNKRLFGTIIKIPNKQVIQTTEIAAKITV